MELGKYLQPLVEGHVIPVENNIDARLNNVQGYLKYGKNKWAKSLSEAAPPAQEEIPEVPDQNSPEDPDGKSTKNGSKGFKWLKR